jgi:hypothetical protein
VDGDGFRDLAERHALILGKTQDSQDRPMRHRQVVAAQDPFDLAGDCAADAQHLDGERVFRLPPELLAPTLSEVHHHAPHARGFSLAGGRNVLAAAAAATVHAQ